MHILHTVLFIFSKGADKERFILQTKSFFSFKLVIIFFVLMILMFDSGAYCKEKSDASNS